MKYGESPSRVPWDQMTDEELFVAYCEGNMTALEMLLGRISRPLFRTILRHIGDRSLAEDILQDTFERIIRNRSKFDPSRSFRAWTWSIALRRCVDYLRRKGRELLLDKPDAGCDQSANPEQRAVQSENIARFTKALTTLTEEQLEVFHLREEAGLSFAQISEATGRPVGTVLTQMHTALKKLQKALEE